MSGAPFVELGDLDGTHGLVRTFGYVNWVEDVSSHRPRQRVGLGLYGDSVVCTVWIDDVTLEKGVGYTLLGVDDVWPDGDEVQLKLKRNCWARTNE